MDQLSEKQIWYYHIIPEYQTEKSFYACVRRSGMIKFDTFYFPHMLSARETQRSIKFGDGVWSGCLYDPDIYTDGKISIQGVGGVLFPREAEIGGCVCLCLIFLIKLGLSTKYMKSHVSFDVSCDL
ncbi:hypothetical protein AtNW77_Chr5g0088741 [Arabidopsis thaliana]|uniref:Fasciclin-like arabinogalactan protein 17 n=3 Tax=Arabidopsis TaxID=3701 RepID=Q9FFK9_ARATH|nr:fasciclin-like arabinogalactan protein 17 precursor [Arabidopsis thaliana]AED90903.1 fasciclin-like arabinogalactan protein 17 precursor [Arabidopsis thaliana]KAG7601288.1 hypothetical protein ISN45_At05g004820 [Arabidopsis thaliana x Arabidopsis arenosa]OAO91645.1 hypothetical protein AXX17_AT5G05150 [Arabidopsis thaliana]BAB09659.1 unnamed protein product [Arabidopsis thaliana]|eukprot:NP_196184.1 fasciclin-like arabinogalactan protein 17 precursor [Arabidopsis thaliana]